MDWLQQHWLQIVATVWSLDQFLKIFSKLTPTTVDDNIADMIGSWLAKFFPQK